MKSENNLTKQNPKGILFIYLRVFTASNILRSLANNLHHLLAWPSRTHCTRCLRTREIHYLSCWGTFEKGRTGFFNAYQIYYTL